MELNSEGGVWGTEGHWKVWEDLRCGNMYDFDPDNFSNIHLKD